MIKLLLSILLFFSISLPVMADTVTYYFDDYDSGGEEWISWPDRMVDGDTGTLATTYSDNDTELLLTNTGNGSDLGTITKVEIRAYGQDQTYDLQGYIKIRPVFGGSSDGDDHIVDPFPEYSSAWCDYVDITSDTNAPVTWSWSDVQDLDCDIVAVVGGFNIILVAKVEIQVTYTTGATPARRIIMVQ